MRERLAVCSIPELFRAVVCIDKVKHSQRRLADVVMELEELTRRYLSEKLSEMDLDEIRFCEPVVRNAIYAVVCMEPILTKDQMERLLDLERCV